MKKKVIVIASVLKPVTDPRMYEKIGMALAGRENHEVHIIGFCSRKHVRHANMYFHVILCANRLSWKRFAVSYKYYKKLLEVKPDVVVAASPDILIVTIIHRILFRSRFFYDVQENYFLNLVHTDAFPVFIRNMFAVFVRGVEWCTRPFADGYLLAERCYARELPFVKDKYVLVENKYAPQTDVLVVPRRRGRYKLLYTGTIAESYGVFEAVALAKELHKLDPRYTLTIAGFASRESERVRLREMTAGCPFIRLLGVDYPLPHDQIIRCIGEADVGLMPYRYNRSTRDRIPTKFYEYMYHRIPFIIPKNSLWESFCLPYRSFLAIDFLSFDAPLLARQLQELTFYHAPSDYNTLLFDTKILSKYKY